MFRSDNLLVVDASRSGVGIILEDIAPGGGVVGLRVEQGGITETTIVVAVLVVEGVLSLVSNTDEVVDGLTVSEVLVQVVLEVLEDVHVLLDELVSADAREPERLVVELPSVNLDLGVETLPLKFAIDLHGSVVVSLVEVAGEVIELDVKLLLGHIDGWFAVVGESYSASRANQCEDESHF